MDKAPKMPKRHKVQVTVLSQNGLCRQGHKVGDQWILEGKTPVMCPAAWNVLFVDVRPLMLGASFDWTEDPNRCTVQCPDNENPVVFEVRRID